MIALVKETARRYALRLIVFRRMRDRPRSDRLIARENPVEPAANIGQILLLHGRPRSMRRNLLGDGILDATDRILVR